MKRVYGCYWGLLSLFMYEAGDYNACCFAKANVIRPLTCDSVQIYAVNGKRCSIKWKIMRYVGPMTRCRLRGLLKYVISIAPFSYLLF